MIWAVLLFLGVPLWLCAAGILAILYRNRSLRKRANNVPVRVLRPGKSRWTRAHAIWISNVFAWRASPAAWIEDLSEITALSVRPATTDEKGHLHRLDDLPIVATLQLADGTELAVATRHELRDDLLGPFADAHAPTPS